MNLEFKHKLIIYLLAVIAPAFIVPTLYADTVIYPSVFLSASPASLASGDPVTLSWSSINADYCNAYDGWSGVKPASGRETVYPASNTFFSLICFNQYGQYPARLLVTVSNPQTGQTTQTTQTHPSVWISAAPKILNPGSGTYLMWNSSNAFDCVASDGWSGAKATGGTELVYPTSSSNFAITCSGATSDLKSSANVWVTVDTSLTTPYYSSAPGYSYAAYNYPSYTYGGNSGSYYYGSSYTSYGAPSNSGSGAAFGVACAATPATAQIGEQINFSAGQYGGASPYRYSWTGDISSTAQSLTATFASAGQKTAKVSVTDSYGRVATGTCYINIINPAAAPVTAYAPPPKITPITKKPATPLVVSGPAASKTTSAEIVAVSDAACRAIGYVKESEIRLAVADQFPENDLAAAQGANKAESLSVYPPSARNAGISVWTFMFFWYLIPAAFMFLGLIIARRSKVAAKKENAELDAVLPGEPDFLKSVKTHPPTQEGF